MVKKSPYIYNDGNFFNNWRYHKISIVYTSKTANPVNEGCKQSPQ